MNRKEAGGKAALRLGSGFLNRNGSYTSVKQLNRIQVVHARSVATEIAEVLVSERGRWYGVEGDGWRGDEPTQVNAKGGRVDQVETAGVDEVDARGVWAGEAVGSGAVEVGGWLRESGKGAGIAIGEPFR